MIGPFSQRIYAVRAYKEFGVDENGMPKYISNWKEDVTTQAIDMVYRHVKACEEPDCLCKKAFANGRQEVSQDGQG